MDKEYVATEEMKKFFENLLALKAFVKQKASESRDDTIQEIYNRLDKIIKEGK